MPFASKKQRRLPRTGVLRETLRAKGQFWTPDWIADVMVAYVLQDRPNQLLDPALGEGAFFRAAKRYAQVSRLNLTLIGRDVDADVLIRAKNSGLDDEDLRHVEIRDFILDSRQDVFPAIIANPPYIRHHRISTSLKSQLGDFARKMTGRHIDGRAGLHVYFLIRALNALASGGRLAYIVSADICEGIFTHALWQWICSLYKLDAVITFKSKITPFPDVDTNALVFLIQNEKPTAQFDWIECDDRDPLGLIAVVTGQQGMQLPRIKVHRRSLSEGLSTGLSRPPTDCCTQFTLGDFASVMRGIATGANDFFFMTHARAKELGIPDYLLVKAIGRTRDVQGETIDQIDLERLEASKRPTRLISIGDLPLHDLSLSVQKYLKVGEKIGLPSRALIMTRKPWYRMERREVPPFIFAYLGRRSARFIRNRASVVPLTSFLCVYPHHNSKEFNKQLWNVLSNPETIANLRKVGKSYGGDAIKVEPRALERLPLPDALVFKERLDRYVAPKQRTLGLELQ
ncbi:MAG: N-6 DNA methylase [Nitrospinae bacterium]|nr:N-6 DNA methylase [Nitrospinota bacterium]